MVAPRPQHRPRGHLASLAPGAYADRDMAFNPECLGRRYEAGPQIVDRERHRAYLNAVWQGADWEPSRPLATFASVYLLWPIVPLLFSDPEVDLDLPRLLHGEQDFWFDRPIRFGEQLTPSGEITRAEERRGMVFLELTCRGQDEDGRDVAHSRSLFLVRSAT